MASESERKCSPAQPLDEAWWADIKPPVYPDGVPLLAPYGKSRPGFELGVVAADPGSAEYFKEVGDGYYEVCLWNVWEKQKDPAESDDDKQKINEMQRGLAALDDDTRFVRIQIACLNRCYWTFPGNVDLALRGIASGRPDLDAGISCEPPWTGMREMLYRRRNPSAAARRHPVAWLHHQQGGCPFNDPRQELLRAYVTIITWWSAAGDLLCLQHFLPHHADLAQTIYRRLGRPTKLKSLYVMKLCWNLNFSALPGLPIEERADKRAELSKVYDKAIQQELAGKADTIGPLIDRNDDNGTCHHAFFRHIDHQIASIGTGRMVQLPGAGQERKRIHATVTNYVHVLGSWLAGRTPEEAVAIWPHCAETAQRLYGVLGDSTPRKRWLVACLWRKLQETQTHAGRGALDEQPEVFALPPTALQVH